MLDWVESSFKKEIKYNTLLKYTNREFGASVKVALKSHVKKDNQAVAAFKKTLVKSAKKPVKKEQRRIKKVNLYFEDESRFGLYTRNGKASNAKGVKPICPFQQVFQST